MDTANIVFIGFWNRLLKQKKKKCSKGLSSKVTDEVYGLKYNLLKRVYCLRVTLCYSVLALRKDNDG